MVWKQRTRQFIETILVLFPFQDNSPMCFLPLRPVLSSCYSISSSRTHFNAGFHLSPSISNAQLTIFTHPEKRLISPPRIFSSPSFLSFSFQLVFPPAPFTSLSPLPLKLLFPSSFQLRFLTAPSSLPMASKSSCHFSHASCFKKNLFPTHSLPHLLPKNFLKGDKKKCSKNNQKNLDKKWGFTWV